MGAIHPLLKVLVKYHLHLYMISPPMKADTEVVTRSTTWESPYEEGGEYRWDLITQQLAHLCDPRLSLRTLKSLAVKLLGLKERLIQRGVPEQIIKMPVLSFDYIEAKLKRWNLL